MGRIKDDLKPKSLLCLLLHTIFIFIVAEHQIFQLQFFLLGRTSAKRAFWVGCVAPLQSGKVLTNFALREELAWVQIHCANPILFSFLHSFPWNPLSVRKGGSSLCAPF